MRFYQPKPDDKRIKTKFLLFPKTIWYETRWLERAAWEQRFIFGCWCDIKWVDDE